MTKLLKRYYHGILHSVCAYVRVWKGSARAYVILINN